MEQINLVSMLHMAVTLHAGILQRSGPGLLNGIQEAMLHSQEDSCFFVDY